MQLNLIYVCRKLVKSWIYDILANLRNISIASRANHCFNKAQKCWINSKRSGPYFRRNLKIIFKFSKASCELTYHANNPNSLSKLYHCGNTSSKGLTNQYLVHSEVTDWAAVMYLISRILQVLSVLPHILSNAKEHHRQSWDTIATLSELRHCIVSLVRVCVP